MTLVGVNRSTGGKICHSATSSITNRTWTDLGSNPGFSGERPVTDLEDKLYLQCTLKCEVRTAL
jgi:hypothetical protein